MTSPVASSAPGHRAAVDPATPVREGVRDLARSLPRWLLAGVAGTAAMTASTELEKALRGQVGHPVNPDASRHVATAVGAVLRRPPRTRREERAYFLLAHWGYGSAVALAYPPLRARAATRTRATGVFLAGCQGMAMALFPTLGGTPAPHRWRRSVLVSSVAHHVVYAATVAAVDALTAPGPTPDRPDHRAGPAGAA